MVSLLSSRFLDRISYVSVRAADQGDADQNYTTTPATMTVSARLGPYLTTLPVCRRSSAAPLGRIDYNAVDGGSPTCERLPMASWLCLLTPAQTLLVHALGKVHGHTRTMRS